MESISNRTYLDSMKNIENKNIRFSKIFRGEKIPTLINANDNSDFIRASFLLLNDEISYNDLLIYSSDEIKMIADFIFNTQTNKKILVYDVIPLIKMNKEKFLSYNEKSIISDFNRILNDVDPDGLIKNIFNKIYNLNDITYDMFFDVNIIYATGKTKYIGLFSYLLNYKRGIYTREKKLYNEEKTDLPLLYYKIPLLNTADITEDLLVETSEIFKNFMTQLSKRTINY